LKITYL